MNTRTHGARRVLLLLEQVGRHDHIGVDRPQRDTEPLGHSGAPGSRFSQRVLVTDHHAGVNLVRECLDAVVGGESEDQSDPATGQRGLELGESLKEKLVVAVIPVRVERHRCQEDDHRLSERVPNPDGGVQRRVVDGPLGSLHPVDDAAPGGIRVAWGPPGQPRVGRELLQCVRHR